MKNLIRVWDLPTRLFHWTLAIAVFYSWFSMEVLENMQQHFYSGYVVLSLLLFRLVWGLVGSYYARFSSFPCSPRSILNYLKGLRSPKPERYLGHNPLGSLSAILMILLVLVQAVLGLFSSDDYFFGPLSGLVDSKVMTWASEMHLLNSNAVFAVIGLHIAAILYYQLIKKERLTKAMITGDKVLIDGVEYVDGQPTKPANKWLALLVFFLCVGVVYYLTTAFFDSLPSASDSYY